MTSCERVKSDLKKKFADKRPIMLHKYVQNWLETCRLVKNHFGNDVYIKGNCDQAPFSLASMLRTPGEWMMDLLMNEKFALPYEKKWLI